jgi:hypothetical protein
VPDKTILNLDEAIQSQKDEGLSAIHAPSPCFIPDV